MHLLSISLDLEWNGGFDLIIEFTVVLCILGINGSYRRGSLFIRYNH